MNKIKLKDFNELCKLLKQFIKDSKSETGRVETTYTYITYNNVTFYIENLGYHNNKLFLPGDIELIVNENNIYSIANMIKLLGSDNKVNDIDNKVNDILKDREEQYGRVGMVAHKYQQLIQAMQVVSYNKESIYAYCMSGICMKLARLSENPDHKDSLIDIIGYTKLFIEELEQYERDGIINKTSPEQACDERI